MAIMQAPGGVDPGDTFQLPLTGNSFTVDADGFVTATAQSDIVALQAQGFLQGGRDTLAATTDPGVNDDAGDDYAAGSIWINATASRAFICQSASLGAAVWIQISAGLVAGSATFINLTLTGLLNASHTGSITAFSGGGQGSAVALTTIVNNITTVAAANDSFKLPAATAGRICIVNNSGANTAQAFGASTDTINSIATATGVPQAVGLQIYICNVTGNWVTLFGNNPQANYKINTNSGTTNIAETAARITGGAVGVILHLTGALGSGQTWTLPSMASVLLALPDTSVGLNYTLRLLNESSANFAWTITNNSWTTFTVPNPALAQKTFQDLLITVLSAGGLRIEAIGNAAFGNTAQP